MQHEGEQRRDERAASSLVAPERMRSIQRTIDANIGAMEAGGRMTPGVLSALMNERLFRLFLPRWLDGEEVDLIEALRLFEEVAVTDGSTGWTLALGAKVGFLGGCLPKSLAEEVFRAPDSIGCVSASPAGSRLQRAKDGFRISGRWPFLSGCTHSKWFFLSSMLHEPSASGGAPQVRLAIVDRASIEILDTWDVFGMRGTGSNDVAIPEEITLPERFCLDWGPVAGGQADGPALYRIPLFTFTILPITAVALGIARRAIEEGVRLAADKKQLGQRLNERELAQLQVGEAEAALRAARALYYEEAERIWEAAQRRGQLSPQERQRSNLACVHAVEATQRAVDQIFDMTGSTSLYRSFPVERCWRDIHALAKQNRYARYQYARHGRLLFGLEAPPNFLY